MKKSIYIIIIVAVIVVAAILWWIMAKPVPQSQPAVSGTSPSVSTTVPENAQGIESYVNNVDVGNVDQQFQSIDQGINSL